LTTSTIGTLADGSNYIDITVSGSPLPAGPKAIVFT